MIKILKNFNRLLDRSQKKRLILLFFITVVGAFLEVLGVSLMVPMVTAIMQPDIIVSNAIIKKVCEIFGLQSHRTFVLLCVLFLIVIFAIKNVYLLFEYYVQARFVYNNKFKTQTQVFHSYLCRPYEFFLNSESGDIMREINGDVQETYELLRTLLYFVTESVVSLALLITVFIVDHTMTTCIAVMMVLIVFAITKVVKPILNRKGNESRKYSSLGYRWLLQAVEGIKEVKISNKEKFFEEKFQQSGKKVISAEKWKAVLGSAPRLLIEAGCVCSTLAVIAIMIYKGKPMEELIPALAAFAMAAIKLMPSANRIVGAINDMTYHGPALEKVLNSINHINDFEEKECNDRPKLTLADKIELKNIVYHYPNAETNVLNNADMTIPIGSSVGIIGKSGAGKTTAVDVMLGLLNPKSGQVTADGVDVTTNYADWLSHIGYIPQTIFILNDTIRGNVTFGNVEDDKKVWKALKAASLDDFVSKLPNGIDTEIGERGIRLSGGQRQRLGIARALYNDPELLVFDEATSSLDGETEKSIMDSINGLHGNKTLIIIAHRLQTIQACDIVYKVQDGKIFKEKQL